MVCITVWGAPPRPRTQRRPPLHQWLRCCFHHQQRNQGSFATATRSTSPLACHHLNHCPVRRSHAFYLPLRVRRRRSPLHCHRLAKCWSAARVPTGTARLHSDLTENQRPVSSRYLKTFTELITDSWKRLITRRKNA